MGLNGVVGNSRESANFDCKPRYSDRDNKMTSYFDGIEFQTTPGYTLEELEREKRHCDSLEVMDAVREGVENYFARRPK